MLALILWLVRVPLQTLIPTIYAIPAAKTGANRLSPAIAHALQAVLLLLRESCIFLAMSDMIAIATI
jgi:hypothetical protein